MSYYYTSRNEVWAKVMFLQASVISCQQGGCHASVHAGRYTHTPLCCGPPPEADANLNQTHTPWEQTPLLADTPQKRHPPGSYDCYPPEQTPPRSRHPSRCQYMAFKQIPPSSRHPPPGFKLPANGQRAAGAHPNGMQSCLVKVWSIFLRNTFCAVSCFSCLKPFVFLVYEKISVLPNTTSSTNNPSNPN